MKNKHHILQTLKIAILALVAIPMVACQTTASAPGKAVMCDKCKTVWVSRPGSIGAGTKGGPGYIAYRDVKTHGVPGMRKRRGHLLQDGIAPPQLHSLRRRGADALRIALNHQVPQYRGVLTSLQSHPAAIAGWLPFDAPQPPGAES